MALLKDLDDFDTNGKKGDWCFLNDHSYIAIQLGDEKFTESCVLPILSNKTGKTFKDRETGRPYWNWNGNIENPTLTPSILHWGNGRKTPATWHGYLTDGKLVTV